MDIFEHLHAARPLTDLRHHDANGHAPAPTGVEDWDAALVAATEFIDPELAFVLACRDVDWERRSAEDYVRAVRLAFLAGAHMKARTLSEEGHERYPDDEQLAYFAWVLAPPRIVPTQGRPTDLSFVAAQPWLREHSSKYLGQWVALRNGQLLMAARDLSEITGAFDSLEGIFITKVL